MQWKLIYLENMLVVLDKMTWKRNNLKLTKMSLSNLTAIQITAAQGIGVLLTAVNTQIFNKHFNGKVKVCISNKIPGDINAVDISGLETFYVE